MRAVLGVMALGIGALALASCGGQRTFEAGEFVTELDERGAAIGLGEPLPAANAETEIYSIELPKSEAAHGGGDEHAGATEGDPAGEAHAHGGGSLYAFPDEDAALDRYRDCASAASLICFRAANVFLVFEDAGRTDLADLEAAIAALGESG